jgi:hypothetical protein
MKEPRLGYPEVGRTCRLQQQGHERVAGEHGERRGHCRELQHQAGNLHEDDLSWRRPGHGVKDYRVIFVFEDDKALAQFLDSGWSGSAQTVAAAKAGKSGAAYSGAVEVAPGVWVYQITKNGLALQLTLQGTKYYKDDELNKS